MPWEYALMAEGYEEAQQARLRQEANWMAFLLSAQTGKPITPAQLLGEEPADLSEEQKQQQGLKRIAEIERKLSRRKKKR